MPGQKNTLYAPEKFTPERREEEATKQIPKHAYFPFGSGNRMYLGEGFAWMEGVFVLALIGSRLDVDLPQNSALKSICCFR